MNGIPGTFGFCNVTLPKALVISSSNIKVLFDGKKIGFTLNEDESNYYVYIAYQHSEHTITISFALTLVVGLFPSVRGFNHDGDWNSDSCYLG